MRLGPFDPWAFAAFGSCALGHFLRGRYGRYERGGSCRLQGRTPSNSSHSINYVLLAAMLARIGRLEEAKTACRTQVFGIAPPLSGTAGNFPELDCAPELSTALCEMLGAVGLTRIMPQFAGRHVAYWHRSCRSGMSARLSVCREEGRTSGSKSCLPPKAHAIDPKRLLIPRRGHQRRKVGARARHRLKCKKQLFRHTKKRNEGQGVSYKGNGARTRLHRCHRQRGRLSQGAPSEADSLAPHFGPSKLDNGEGRNSHDGNGDQALEQALAHHKMAPMGSGHQHQINCGKGHQSDKRNSD